jgi:hypothetical protein
MASLGLPEEDWLDRFGRALIGCFELAATRNGKKRWADKNPENAINIWHWDRLLVHNLDFILVVRHPLDIIASMEETPMKQIIPKDLKGRAAHILSHINYGLEYCEAYPLRASILRYEELVQHPQYTLEGLLARIGEEFNPAMLADLGGDCHGRGIEDPKARARSQISAEGVRRWARDFTPVQVVRLHSELGGLMERLGYDLR